MILRPKILLALIVALFATIAASASAYPIVSVIGTGFDSEEEALVKEYDFIPQRIDMENDFGGLEIAETVERGFDKDDEIIVGNQEPMSTSLGSYDRATWLSKTMAQIAEVEKYKADVSVMELINEPDLKGGKAEPLVYAELYLEVKRAMKKAKDKIPLCYYSTGDYFTGTEWSDAIEERGWVGDAVKAFPALKTEVSCWTNHPYGHAHVAYNGAVGPDGMEIVHEEIVKLGCKHTNVYATEFGFKLNVGHEDYEELEAGSEAQQAQWTKEALEQFTKLSWVKGIWQYALHDEFGNEKTKWGLIDYPWEGSQDTRAAFYTLASFVKKQDQ
jgi:hypothetical protein